jgi:ATP/maltotriose-dependent transcriptional regulator MalT
VTAPRRQVEEARAAYAARSWRLAFEAYAAADQHHADLHPDDLDRYAVTAHLLGRMEEYFTIREREYGARIARDDLLGAARAAGWIGSQRMVMGQVGPGTGWLARAARHVEEDGRDCVEQGYVLLSKSLAAAASGDAERALELLSDSVACARRFGDPDLTALTLHQHGLTLLRAGEVARGLVLLDEAMVSLATSEPSPMVTGIVYCGVIQGCWSVYELRRAGEWTSQMTAWCDAQPDMANFTGECKVRRAELKQLHGSWSEALEELAGVRDLGADLWTAATAAYVRGELDRLQGRFDAAEEAFQITARLGTEPQPGLALLRMARGSREAAAAMVRRAMADAGAERRVELLVAGTEILLAVDDPDGARGCVEELAKVQHAHASPITRALVDHACAQLDVHLGRPEAALGRLRTALHVFVEMPAPYQEARARVLLAACCRAMGDEESADRELDTARVIFAELGAAPDLARVDARRRTTGGILTPRELEVLRLVARGLTNKGIAADLVLSERTVDRHVSNIFVKLGVSTRAAATAYAFERQLV